MQKIVFCDFDGTISKEDSTDLILECFSIRDNWRGVEEKWQNGFIGSRDCLIEQFKDVHANQLDIELLVERLHIENGFVEFVQFCKAKGLQFYIVSAGINSVIRKFLQIHKIDGVDNIYANDIQYFPNGVVQFNCMTDTAGYNCNHDLACANCKPAIVNEVLRSHNASHQDAIYIGDGLSDLLAAMECSTIFAREKLCSALQERAVVSRKFTTFFDIISSLSRLETL